MEFFKRYTIAMVLIFIAGILFSGCTAGNSNSAVDQTGAFSMSVAWPDQSGRSVDKKAIPSNSSTILVSISGQWIDDPITSSISSGTTTLTISNVPVGYKVALIKALDSSGNITAQRKESFTVTEGQTATADHVPLGVAITGTTTTPVFEPSNLKISYGSLLYVQNWLESDYTCSMTLPTSIQNLPIGKAVIPSQGQATFNSVSFSPREKCSFSLAENSGVQGNVNAVVSNYTYFTQFGGTGTGDGEFGNPYGVYGFAMDSTGNFYIADVYNHRIQKFNSSYGFASKWGGTANSSADGLYNNPVGVAIDSAGFVYVTDNGNARVQKLNSSGGFISKWGSRGTGVNLFTNMHGICIDSSDSVYVVDLENDYIQKFKSDGTFLSKWGTTGTGNGNLITPRGIAADRAGNIYVTNQDNCRIEKFDSVGNFLSKWGSYGTGDGQFASNLTSLGIDQWDNVFVTDCGLRVQKFDSLGNYICKFGSNGPGNGHFSSTMQSVCVTPSGNVFVSDLVLNKIQGFMPAIP